jgi:hypothetical protein
MNVARSIDTNDRTYKNQLSKKAVKSNSTNVITLIGVKPSEEKKVTLEYLNEKLAYFYNNGGPIMDI